MNRRQDSTLLKPTFISFSFILGDAESHQRSGKATHSSNGSRSGEGCHDWARSNQRPKSRDREYADASQPTQRAAN